MMICDQREVVAQSGWEWEEAGDGVGVVRRRYCTDPTRGACKKYNLA